MKTFFDYLVESEKTYAYRIKIAGEVRPDAIKGMKEKLAQFEPVKIGDVRTTPVQKTLSDFPGVENQRVHMFDVELRYPAIHPQITSIGQMLGIDPNLICFKTVGYEEGMEQELDKIQDQNQNLLTDTDFPAPDKEQKQLKKEYEAVGKDKEVVQNSYRSRFTVAGGRTPPAETTNDLPQGDKSPIGGQNRLPAVKSNAR